MLKLLLILVPLFIAYFGYSIDKLLDLSKENIYHDYQSCKKIPLEMPTEDLAVFGDYIIGASSDCDSVFNKHFVAASMIPGYLISYHTKTENVSKIPMKNFPSNFQMNPHGISLFNNKTLYVLSHSYGKGGEMIFVFDIDFDKEITATFIKHISLGNDHGIYNGIAFVDSNNFYVTQWIPFPDPEQGRDTSFFTGLYRTLLTIYTRTNGVKHCTVSGDNTAACSFKSRGYMPNGILYKDNTLYVLDSVPRTVYIYNVDMNFELSEVDSIALPHPGDNLSMKNGEIYAAGINRGIDYLKYEHSMKHNLSKHFAPGGVSKAYKKNGKWVIRELLMQEILSFPTAVVATREEIIISSYSDPSLLVCKIR